MRTRRHPDFFLLGLVFILVVFGLVILSSASSDLGKTKWNDSYYFLKHQLLYGLSLGIVGFLFAYFIPYQNFKKIALILLILNLGLVALVFVPGLGVSAGGASRWIKLGPYTFQPAELLKLTFILYLASWLTDLKSRRAKDFKRGFLPFIVICGIVAGLLIFQPATSTVAILLAAALCMYFLSGAEWKYIFSIISLGALGLAILVIVTPYRLQRITSFLRPSQDSLGSNYHLNQAKIAIGSGELFGTGFGKSTAKTTYLPAVIDDSIFAVMAQELGFIGAASLVVLFLLLTLRLFWMALKSRDQFGKLNLVGFAVIIGLQSLVNMGSISGILPLTGVPLPFISYGGTALAVFMTMSGVALNISKNQ
jgi:cell division protein FtsW